MENPGIICRKTSLYYLKSCNFSQQKLPLDPHEFWLQAIIQGRLAKIAFIAAVFERK